MLCVFVKDLWFVLLVYILSSDFLNFYLPIYTIDFLFFIFKMGEAMASSGPLVISSLRTTSLLPSTSSIMWGRESLWDRAAMRWPSQSLIVTPILASLVSWKIAHLLHQNLLELGTKMKCYKTYGPKQKTPHNINVFPIFSHHA